MTSSFRIDQHLLGAPLELAIVELLGAPRVTYSFQSALGLAYSSRSVLGHVQLPQRAQQRIRCFRLKRPQQLSPVSQAEGRRSRCSDCVVVSAAASPGTPYHNTAQLRQLGLVLGITDYKDLQRLIRRQPDVLDVSPAVVLTRVLQLRALLPSVNLPALVQRRPRLLTQDSLAAVESALRRLERLMPGYDLQADGKLLELHVWQNFTSCLDEARP